MITVIATGFDGSRKRDIEPPAPRPRRPTDSRRRSGRRASATSSRSSSASAAQSTDGGVDTGRGERPRTAAAVIGAAHRAVRRRAGAGQAGRGLRRRRPGDPGFLRRGSRSPPGVLGLMASPALRLSLGDAAADAEGRRHPRPIARSVAAARGSRPRAHRRCGRRAGRDPPASRSSPSRRRSPPERLRRRGRRRADDARREPRPGGRGEGRPRVAGRDVAPRRAAPVEQGAPGARDVRHDRVGRLGRACRAPRPRSRPRSGPGSRVPVLLQVNVDDDPAKAGFAPADLERDLAGDPRACARLEVRGLMTVGRLVERAGRGAADVRRPCATSSARLRGATRGARAGAVDGHERRLRGRRRGGRDDRPGRAGDLRRASLSEASPAPQSGSGATSPSGSVEPTLTRGSCRRRPRQRAIARRFSSSVSGMLPNRARA